VTADTELGSKEPESTGPESAEPESGGPEQPENPAGVKWKIFVGCLLAIFVLLGVFDLTSKVTSLGGDGSASGTTSPAARHPAAAPASAASLPSASLPSASPIAVSPAPSQQGLFTTPAATPAPRPLAVSAIAAFGPEGMSDGDNPGAAYRALDDDAEPWYSSWYLSPEFGNLKAGTGLLLDMGKTVTVSSVRLSLGRQSGAAVQVRVGDTAALADMFIVSTATDIGGTVQLPTQVRASGRYVLIWFTELPPIGHGEYQVSVYDAAVDGIVGS
jgi:hypothetical protein